MPLPVLSWRCVTPAFCKKLIPKSEKPACYVNHLLLCMLYCKVDHANFIMVETKAEKPSTKVPRLATSPATRSQNPLSTSYSRLQTQPKAPQHT